LKQARWNVKAAIVMKKTGVTYTQAIRRLKAADDSVRDALGEDLAPTLRRLLNRR
jgi:N-acetylmuramic acid 6-phosphate (MurNAc-6-P) etherase